MLLKGHALGNNVAFRSLPAPPNFFRNQFIVFGALDLRSDQISASPHGVHVVSLQQVVKRVQIEALVEQLEVDLFGQAHQSDCLVLDLGHECFV